ncbi:MAG: LytTR family transcriptional regulator DNA-binding domain-containing protein [Lachnospiraceae bacterium]|nr:LytTR family transcriptional regulator DNA-binding domain-containing protein [Lachnospiraceae bacterium]MDE6184999.1 LytTR family transcriptional regulator DNA-binding domain-containing protein [Lachnospiraceae bacterium]
MKIAINVDENVKDIEITISCSRLTPEIEKMLATLRIMDWQLTASKGGETYLLDVSKVIYLESVDRKTFVYTGESVYESSLKLYELEQQLDERGFFRASKSCLVQLKYIRSLKADINRRIRVTLENGEQIIVSRQYAEGLKKKLGVK